MYLFALFQSSECKVNRNELFCVSCCDRRTKKTAQNILEMVFLSMLFCINVIKVFLCMYGRCNQCFLMHVRLNDDCYCWMHNEFLKCVSYTQNRKEDYCIFPYIVFFFWWNISNMRHLTWQLVLILFYAWRVS